MTYAEKIAAQAGLVRTISFNAGHLTGVYGDNVGVTPGDINSPALDTTITASGQNSIKFTIPTASGANSSGSWFMNFSTDLATQFGAGQTFYVQYMQKFDRFMFEHHFTGGGGWKQSIIGTGDTSGNPVGSHSDMECVMQNTEQRAFPQMYNENGGSIPWNETTGVGIKLQNAVDHGAGANNVRYCLYDTDFDGCIMYADGLASGGDQVTKWATITIKITVGSLVGTTYQSCLGEVWWSWTGGAADKIFNYTYDQPFSAGPTQKYGKLWFLPYHTSKDSSESHQSTFVWYANPIIATSAIPLTTDELSKIAMVTR